MQRDRGHLVIGAKISRDFGSVVVDLLGADQVGVVGSDCLWWWVGHRYKLFYGFSDKKNLVHVLSLPRIFLQCIPAEPWTAY